MQLLITYAYFVLENDIYDWLMRSRSKLHITYVSERRKIEDTLFDSAEGSGSIKGGVVEGEELKQPIQG